MEVIADHIEELYARLNRLEQLKTNTMRLASHDLRSSIGLVNGYLQLIRLDVYPHLAAHEREYVDDLARSVQRMNTILSDMLALERIYQIAEKPLSGQADLVDVVQRAAQAYYEPLEDKKITLEIIAQEKPWLVTGDAPQLLETVTNFLSNALRYTPEGGKIIIRLFQKEDSAVLEVCDSGTGVPESYEGKLFQPFYKIKPANSDEAPRPGLGLYLVKNIIERHRGEVIFYNNPVGSTFGFKLPL